MGNDRNLDFCFPRLLRYGSIRYRPVFLTLLLPPSARIIPPAVSAIMQSPCPTSRNAMVFRLITGTAVMHRIPI